MFKKITAVLAAVLLGVGISVVAVAAPASAHTPNYGVSCDSLWVNPTQYETRNDNPKPNKITVVIDGETVLDTTFGGSLPKQTFNFDGSTSHTWSIAIDAVGGTNNTQYDWTKSGVTTPCSYPDRDLELECGTATAILDAALANGNHINMEVLINGVTKTLNAYVDQNVPGGWSGPGWNQAGIRFTDINGVQTSAPLTEQQILSGKFTFKYGDYLGGATSYSVVWVQMETVHFNDTKVVSGYLNCGIETVTVEAKPSVTPPTCLEDGKLVIPTQTGITFTGGNNGDGPGTYNLVAVAAPGYKLAEPYSVQLTVKPADPSKCVMEPKASVEVGVCTTTHDNESQKSTTFWFDNSGSQLAVTFTIPSLGITKVVAAGATASVTGPLVDHNVGGSWEVLADGKSLVTLTVAKFADCLENGTPADPSSTDQKCVAGELTDGSITVVPNVGKIVFVITGGSIPAPGITVPDNNPVTTLPAGNYTVTAHGINGYTVGPENTWTYAIVIGAPEDCEKVAIPVSTKSAMVCVAGSPTGSYTLPATEWVAWYVNGVLTTTPTDVHVAGDVLVEAKITPEGLAAGIVFTDGTTVKSVTHTFTLPESCDPPTLALLNPTASQNNGSCTADPTYTLSNTTSEHGGVQWWIGDPQVKTTPGTHKATWGSTVVVEATVVDPINDGLEHSPAVWTFKFPVKPACGDLLTLALTGGSTGGFVPWIAGTLLLLGGAGIYFKRRLVTTSK